LRHDHLLQRFSKTMPLTVKKRRRVKLGCLRDRRTANSGFLLENAYANPSVYVQIGLQNFLWVSHAQRKLLERRLKWTVQAIRIGTPIRSFSRHTSKPVEIAGHQLPKRARVMMLYSSANRDETIFPQADKFDIERRNARRHLAFGAGVHMCAGMHLALLEIECLILAMTQQMPAVTVGTPTIAMNNSICAFAELPVHIQG
jgi:hypothetical protein